MIAALVLALGLAAHRPAPPHVSAARFQDSPVVLHIRAKKGARLRCSVDRHAPRPCTRRTKLKLSAGAYSIAVWAVAHGRASRKRQVQVVVPTPAPAAVRVGGTPVAIAAAAQDLWVSTSGDAVEVDATTHRVTARITVGGSLGGVAASGPNVWVSVFDGGQVAHIANGAVVGRTNVGGQPTAVALAAGSVWVGNQNGWVNRIDPATGHVLATLHLLSGDSTLLLVGKLLWAGLQDGSLVSIDPATNAVTGSTVHVAPDLDALVDTPQGLWASTFAGVAASIDAVSRKVLHRVHLPSRGGGIAYGGGFVWFSMYDSGLVAELSPFSGSVVGAVHTGLQPRDSLVVGQTLWVVDQGAGKLTPIPVG